MKPTAKCFNNEISTKQKEKQKMPLVRWAAI